MRGQNRGRLPVKGGRAEKGRERSLQQQGPGCNLSPSKDETVRERMLAGPRQATEGPITSWGTRRGVSQEVAN